MAYDAACLTLARHFLSDYQNPTPADEAKLAQAIQTAIEDWFGDQEGRLQERTGGERA